MTPCSLTKEYNFWRSEICSVRNLSFFFFFVNWPVFKSDVINMSYCVYFTECRQWTVSWPPNYLSPEQQTGMPSCCRTRYSVTKLKYGDSFLYRHSEEASWVADRTIGKFAAGWSPEHSSSTLNGCLLLLDRTAARICGSVVARTNFWRAFLDLANSRERSSS